MPGLDGIPASVGGLVVAGRAAGLAVQQTIVAKTDVHDGLAEAAEFFALAGGFKPFALGAFVTGGAGSGAHKCNLSWAAGGRNVT